MVNSRLDTFVTFVDALASRLDDHEARGEDLAAVAYLSRFHFDRVVTATAGETPARFRRRVLLERAAYRLLTSERGVLDVAVEAGYSSNEAFTRAFQRAYEVGPAAWRKRPHRPIQLAAPNGVHFHPPGGLRLPARTEVTSMDLLVRMVEHHVWLVGELVDRADRLESNHQSAALDQEIEVSVDDGDDVASLRSLLSRLIGQMDMWNRAIANEVYDWDVEAAEPTGSMKSRLRRVGPTYLDHIRTVCEQGRLDETFVDAVCDPPEVFTYGGMIAHVLTFAAYRRTLAVQALAAAGVEDLGFGDPMRWVAEPA